VGGRGFGGNPDQFSPALHLMDTQAGHFVTIWQNGPQYFNTTSTHLFRDGKEIPVDRSDPFRTFPLYRLPADPGKYRFAAVDAFPAAQCGGPSLALFRLAPRTETTWEFTSRRPTGTVPADYECGDRCAFQPLIQLNTQLNLDPSNQAQADYQFMINAGYHAGTDGGAPLVNITVQFSTDDGRNWSLATVRAPDQSTNAGRSAILMVRRREFTAVLAGDGWFVVRVRLYRRVSGVPGQADVLSGVECGGCV
jgi:hypothetical protein